MLCLSQLCRLQQLVQHPSHVGVFLVKHARVLPGKLRIHAVHAHLCPVARGVDPSSQKLPAHTVPVVAIRCFHFAGHIDLLSFQSFRDVLIDFRRRHDLNTRSVHLPQHGFQRFLPHISVLHGVQQNSGQRLLCLAPASRLNVEKIQNPVLRTPDRHIRPVYTLRVFHLHFAAQLFLQLVCGPAFACGPVAQPLGLFQFTGVLRFLISLLGCPGVPLIFACFCASCLNFRVQLLCQRLSGLCFLAQPLPFLCLPPVEKLALQRALLHLVVEPPHLEFCRIHLLPLTQQVLHQPLQLQNPCLNLLNTLTGCDGKTSTLYRFEFFQPVLFASCHILNHIHSGIFHLLHQIPWCIVWR